MSDFEHAGSSRLVNLVLKGIAEKGFPDGAIAKCANPKCGKQNEVTTERVIEIMKDWPVHCERNILLMEKP